MDEDRRVENLGRSVYFDGVEIACCVDDASAELIALAIEFVGLPSDRMSWDVRRRLARLTS